MKVSREELVNLFVAMGYKTAAKWKPELLEDKLTKIQSLKDDDVTLEKEPARLLKNIVKAQKAKEVIEVTAAEDDSEKEPPEVTAAKKAHASRNGTSSKPKGKGKKVKVEDDEDEDEDEEDEDEEEDKVEEDEDEDEDEEDEDEDDEPKKKKPVKKPTGKGFPKGEGVIAFIIEMLTEAAKTKPKGISKPDMLKKLKKRFPHKEESALKGTLNTQVPSHLRNKKNLNVQKGDNGFWIAKGEPEPKEEKKPVKPKASTRKKTKDEEE